MSDRILRWLGFTFALLMAPLYVPLIWVFSCVDKEAPWLHGWRNALDFYWFLLTDEVYSPWNYDAWRAKREQNYYGISALEDAQNEVQRFYNALRGTPPPTPPNPREPASLPREAVKQEIVAWRAWDLAEDEHGVLVLRSTVANYEWDGPVARNEEPPPERWEPPPSNVWTIVYRGPLLTECGSNGGFHACKSRVKLENRIALMSCAQPLIMRVSGTVALSGVVIEAENGYRAQVATIRSLIVQAPAFGRHMLEIADELAERYACEVALEPNVGSGYELGRLDASETKAPNGWEPVFPGQMLMMPVGVQSATANFGPLAIQQQTATQFAMTGTFKRIFGAFGTDETSGEAPTTPHPSGFTPTTHDSD